MISGAPSHTHHSIGKWTAESGILAIGAITGLLYLANHWATGAMYSNGAPADVATVSGGPAASAHAVWLQMGCYALVTASLFSAYLGLLSLCRRGALQGRARGLALTIPCLLTVILAASTPVLSEDIFSYMAHGCLGVVPGDNPLLQPADSAAHTVFGPFLAKFGWHGEIGITPYGIVWTRIEVSVMRWCGTHIALALLMLKSVAAIASLGTGLCVWIFLGRVRPAAQLYGTLAYLWNPLILTEFAGEGHNDAVMVFFVVAALAAASTHRVTTSLVAQLLGVLTKYVSVLFLPAHLVYLWRTRRSVTRLAARIAAALLVTLGIASLLYGSLWAGGHSFDGLLNRGQPISSASLFGAINWILRRSPLAAFNGVLTLAAVTLPLLAFIAWASLRVKDAAGLARTVAWISVGYALVSSPDFWPWYSCMPVTLLLVADAEGLMWLAILMSFLAQECAPLDLIRDHGFLGMVAAKGALTGLGTTVPLIALAVWLIRRRAQLRNYFA